MKVLLLNPPADKLHSRDYYCSTSTKADYYWPPTDLLVLSGILEGHEKRILDANALGLSRESALANIRRYNPETVIFLTSTPTLDNDMSFMDEVKRQTKARIFGSGNYLYFKTREAMKRFPFLDGVILDFTDSSVLKLIEGKGPKTGAAYRNRSSVRIMPLSKSKDMSYPVPRHELLDLSRYRLPFARRYPFSSVLASYGCPYKCSFCFCSSFPFRERDLDNLEEELAHMKSLGISEIYFRDYTFTLNRKRTLEMCSLLKKHGFTWICVTRADRVDRELLEVMKDSGCHTIQFGVESGSDEILVKFLKGVDKERIKGAFRDASRLGIRTLAHFILGLPGERREDVLSTIAFAKEIECDYASFNMFVPLIGTPARELVLRKGWLKRDALDSLDSSAEELPVETPWLKREELIELHRKALRDFYLRPGYLFRMLWKRKSLRELFETFRNGLAILRSM